MTTPINVNLNINIEATGEVNVFTQAPTVPTQNVIISQVTVPISILYNGSNDGLIKFRGTGDNIDAIKHTGFTTTAAAITNALHDVVVGGFNASAAAPFNLEKYGLNSGYRNYNTFGHLALATYTDFLLGHVAATAAIDNDTIFIARMNGENDIDAKIASKLATEILAITNENCVSITEQVIGQDASRATGVDNDGSTVNDYQMLEFKDGDSIYMAINLTQPTVTMLNTVNLSQLPSVNSYTTLTYYIKVLLTNAGITPAPAYYK